MRFGAERQRKWCVVAIEQTVPELGRDPVGGALIAVIEAGHAGNVEIDDRRADLEAEVWGGRGFKTQLVAACGIAAVALIPLRQRLVLLLLLADFTDVRASGEAEDELGVDPLLFTRLVSVLRAGMGNPSRHSCDQKRRQGFSRTGMHGNVEANLRAPGTSVA